MDALQIRPQDALIVVDVQNDFLPGGNLAVADGDEVVPVLNRYIALFSRIPAPVFATRDWHPAAHCSFKAQGGVWPPHCIADTRGAALARDLRLPEDALLISKATTEDKDAYSGFEGTQLGRELRARGITRVFVGGIATDYCVLNTVMDALHEGFEVGLLTDAIRAVDAGDGAAAVQVMLQEGAMPVCLSGDAVIRAETNRIEALRAHA